jgi:glutamine synthetase adenylyltransferase
MSDLTDRLRGLYVQNGTNYVQEAADEINRLTAELEEWRFTNKVDELERERDALRERVAVLEQDAARYRYLRDIKRQECLLLKGPEAGVWCDCENEYGELILLTEGDLDAAIDAALNGEAG